MAGVTIVLIILVIVIPIVIAHSKKTTSAWSEAGRQLGLQFTPGSLLRGRKLSGILHGMHVSVSTFTRRSGNKHSATYARFEVHFPRPLGLGIRITREGFLAGITKLFGSQDIQVGDGTFDRSLMVKGRDEHAVRSFLTPARRLRIERFMAWPHENAIDDHSIQSVKRGVPSTSSAITSTVRTMLRLGWHLTGEREDDVPLQHAMQLQNQGQPEEALQVIEATLVQAPDPKLTPSEKMIRQPVEARFLQGELHYLAGDRGRAHQAFQEVHAADPEDEEVNQWLEITKPNASPLTEDDPKSLGSSHPHPLAGSDDDLDKPAAVSDQAVPPAATRSQQEPAAALTALADAPLDQKAFCDALFGESSRSFDVNKRFEEHFQDREVTWNGELLKVERNYSAFIFSESGGTNATFKIDERPSPYYGTDDVLAVVHLPDSALEHLKPRVGQSLAFRGKLVKADGLMRNVYVDHAELA